MESGIEIYKTKDGVTQIEVEFEADTVWLNQKQIAELFKNTISNINMHIKNVYAEKELVKKSTIKKSLIVQKEGKRPELAQVFQRWLSFGETCACHAL